MAVNIEAVWYWCGPEFGSKVSGWAPAYWSGISWYFNAPWGERLEVGVVGPKIESPGSSMRGKSP